MRSLLVLVLTAVLAACSATSSRQPDGTLLGTMSTGALPTVTIDGKEMRLAPGARILGANNTSVTPNQVAPNTPVRYRVDSRGEVSHVWLLRPPK